MWIRKAVRDKNKGVDSPVPTQVVSNEELIPRPQTARQKEVEHLIGELSGIRAKKSGMERRDFMRSSMGIMPPNFITSMSKPNATGCLRMRWIESKSLISKAAGNAAMLPGAGFALTIKTWVRQD